jgi:hypothetical protein
VGKEIGMVELGSALGVWGTVTVCYRRERAERSSDLKEQIRGGPCQMMVEVRGSEMAVLLVGPVEAVVRSL